MARNGAVVEVIQNSPEVASIRGKILKVGATVLLKRGNVVSFRSDGTYYSFDTPHPGDLVREIEP
jgi:hypothetical protein